MRILFTACPLFGHVNTLLPLALAAQRAGHEVAVATGADLGARVARRGLATWPVGPTGAEAGTPSSPAYFWHTAHQRAADLLPLVDTWGPDLVVSEELEFAGAVVAARGGLRHVVHGLGIAAAGDWSMFAASVDELGRQWEVSGLAQMRRAAPYLSICPPSLAPQDPPEGGVRRLRPGLGEPAAGEGLPASLDALPHERTVHLTLGTVFHQLRPGLLDAAVAGLRDLPANLVVTVGPGVDPEHLGPQPPHVLVERYLPHALLLPRCDVVVSQGGAGILLGALAHGLPQLVLPQAADQFANAAAVGGVGAALVLEGSAATPSAICEAVNALLTNPRYVIAARALAAEIDAMPGPDDALASIESGVATHQVARDIGSAPHPTCDRRAGMVRRDGLARGKVVVEVAPS
ncbi:putative glycosyltransferase [Frankia canadensis]|uniref:Putative glycosyltransferase n=1 Tax=Frankia canadensis TaxID=1836972 RepID=A0A2I2KL03_9ACTN|nr:glycosyltransferase [Frankia canadensis]SNQ46317.1 putative glycosyltransferase [Frankia canadensis]SOU53607.1 putative glycosyltransferase [Frankia canadensis]